ncbi:acidic repeat-containing protein-like isoform X2 [Orbicella faveolata]|uniref:acidic repeat-containing protein-like isoform X2 n=1 Tax=Orbicella faveolata TaxID=48498 RepID=UPI0009E3648F|nr:acidic repeat-containing protein-like isoform X2 [Orbicella faveolata]
MKFKVLIKIYPSHCVIFPLYSRNDQSNDNFEGIIISSLINPNKMPSVAEYHSTPLLVNFNERDGNSESDLSTELSSPKSSNNIIENIDIADSPVKTRDVSLSEELGSHSYNEEYCDNGNGNNEHDDADNDDDDDANEDVRNKGTGQDLHHLASLLVKSNEIDGGSGGDVSTDLIHPPKSSKRCSDDEDNNAGHDGIDDDYENEDNVFEDIEDNEAKSHHLASLLINSHEVHGDDESNLSTESTRPKSSMNDDSSNGIEDASFPDSSLKSMHSLSARLFKKYNPEKSESDMDDFELFLQKIRTPKPSELYDGRKKREESTNEFIVADDDDDDDEDQEDDMFFDPGFTPELEEISDDGKENEDIEIATPATSSTLFKTPTSRVLSSNHSSRPKSILDNILVPYSTEKEFKKSKDKLVKELFELYNRTVFDNQMPSDFQITWNPRMRSTAGFCYYSKKNGLRVARIELADKVIDSADRLRDTLIHEMCHAAAWMISGVKAGHGAVWKKWTLRANRAHQDLPPISRCHSYTINAKYTYRCTNNNCANIFGRHSKSVNLEKSRCAYCHSRLELVPQLKKDGTPQTRTPSKFALFVKQNYARIKSDNDRFSHQDVMKALSSEFAKVSTT